MVRFIFALVVLLLFIWRIKKGFANGIMGEIVTILSGAVALVCGAALLCGHQCDGQGDEHVDRVYCRPDPAGNCFQDMQSDLQADPGAQQSFDHRGIE